jgi:hypothetical protein
MSIDFPASTGKKTEFRPGVCVKNGKLYAFSDIRVVVVRGWPEMSAWTKSCRCPQWSRLRPKIDFKRGIIESVHSRRRYRLERRMLKTVSTGEPLGPDAPPHPEKLKAKEVLKQFERERHLVRQYFGDLPLDVQNVIEPFRERQWHLLVMAARCAGSLDLIKSNPALAFCLASPWVFTPMPSRYATSVMRRLIGTTRRHICGALGFPEAEASVSILSKMPPSTCCIPWLLTIRNVLRDPEWRKTLLHLPNLNEAVMQFVGNEPLLSRATPRLLHELSENPVRLGWEMLYVTLLRDKFAASVNERFHSIQQVHRVARELQDQNNRGRESNPPKPEAQKLEFPEPPIPGIENIIPLKNTDLLYEEGQVQHNCLMQYVCTAASGGVYFYRVLEPERATLSIIPDENGQWQIGQLLRAHNEPVSEATRQGVAQWFSRAR